MPPLGEVQPHPKRSSERNSDQGWQESRLVRRRDFTIRTSVRTAIRTSRTKGPGWPHTAAEPDRRPAPDGRTRMSHRSRTQLEAGPTQAHGLRPRPRPRRPPGFRTATAPRARDVPTQGWGPRRRPRSAARSPEVGGAVPRGRRHDHATLDRRDRPGSAGVINRAGRHHHPGRRGLVHTPSAASLRSARSESNRCSTTRMPAPITPARSPSPDVTTSRRPVERGSAR